MINKEKTFQDFGYRIEDLKPNSCKPVYKICDLCKKEQIKEFRSAKNQPLCLKCSNGINARNSLAERTLQIIEWHKTHDHPLLGIPRPQSVKDAISKAHKGIPCSEEVKNNLREKFTGSGNPFYGKQHSKESLEKMSKASRKNVRRGKDSNFYGKHYPAKYITYIAKHGKTYKFKSTWEYKTALYFEQNNIKWDYEPRFFEIKYTYEGKDFEGSYTPDFLLEDGSYWEIKGYFWKDSEAKFNAFKIQYPNIKIKLMTKKELMELNIL